MARLTLAKQSMQSIPVISRVRGSVPKEEGVEGGSGWKPAGSSSTWLHVETLGGGTEVVVLLSGTKQHAFPMQRVLRTRQHFLILPRSDWRGSEEFRSKGEGEDGRRSLAVASGGRRGGESKLRKRRKGQSSLQTETELNGSKTSEYENLPDRDNPTVPEESRRTTSTQQTQRESGKQKEGSRRERVSSDRSRLWALLLFHPLLLARGKGNSDLGM